MRLTSILLISSLVFGCAGQPTDAPDVPDAIDDPRFASWYNKASPYMRTTFFISLCVASGFSRGSVEITLCVSDRRKKARLRVEGTL